MFGDRRIAVVADDVDLDAALGHIGETHVARRPSAEKDDVLERRAALDQIGRHVGVIVDADVVAFEQDRQFGPLERLTIDVDRRIARAQNALPDRRELIVAVEEKGFHRIAWPLTVGALTSNTSPGRRKAATPAVQARTGRSEMRLASYALRGRPSFGVVVGDG